MKQIAERTAQIRAVLDTYMIRPGYCGTPKAAPQDGAPVVLMDQDLIEKAAAAANGYTFRRLWSGDITGYPSHSEADQALCNILAFWTGRDAGRMDQLFRQSGLMRDKWNRKQSGTTYGAITIRNAIRDCKEVYQPREQSITDNSQAETSPQTETDQQTDNTAQNIPMVLHYDASQELPPLKPEIITGILREGHKMLLAGQSKAGKSFDLIELALCFATGARWHGFECKQTKVLYVNMEIDEASFLHRVANIAGRMELQPAAIGDRLLIWNLRGKAAGITGLVEPIKKAAAECGAVIIDPIYKIMEGDENSASEMALFTKNLDKIAESGAAVIFAHHFGKNTQGTYKDPMNRASGSGVFARDPDAIITMSSLDDLSITSEIRQHAGVSDTATGYQLDFTLREFAPVKPFKIWFDYPVHIMDNGSLSGAIVNGAPATKDEKRALKIAVLAKAFAQYKDQIEDDGGIALMFLDNKVDQIGGKRRKAGVKTIREYAKSSAGEFYCNNGKLYKSNGMEPANITPFDDPF